LTSTQNTSFLRPLLNVLRVRRWTVLMVLIALPIAAATFSARQAPEYEASSQVLISRTNLSNVLTGTQDPAAAEFDFNRVVQTQATLARTPRVAQRTLIAAGQDRNQFESFLEQSSVTTSPNNDLLTFAVTNGSRGLAINLAREYARQFVEYKQAATTNRLLKLRADLQREYPKMDPGSAEAHQNRVQLGRVKNLIALGDSSVAVVQTPRAAERIKPKPVRNVMLATVLAVFLGVGLAFLREALDTRVRTSAELEERLGLPLLGRLPCPPRPLRTSDRLVTLVDPASPAAEHFRVLRSSLSFTNIDSPARSILVTSAVQSEGKSTTIANLAVAMARAGQHVILADFDFRRPYLDRFFDLPRQPGATAVATGRADLGQALQRIDLDSYAQDAGGGRGQSPQGQNGNTPPLAEHRSGSLRVLPTGNVPPTVGEFVASHTMGRLVQALAGSADVVLIDAPPLLAVGDAIALSNHVEGVILVARLGLVRRTMLADVQRLLNASPTPAIGLVITDAAAESGGYGYGYGYGYEEDAARAPREPLFGRSKASRTSPIS
jgi:succinoglycan biosynthesis transport protein ExoP